MHAIKLISIIGSLAVVGSGFSQGFINLDFEAAMVSGYSPQSTIPAALAFPGWTVSPAPPFYGGISLGGALVSVHDINTGFGFPLEGDFSAVLAGGIFNTPANISQTAVVPQDTLSIQLMVRSFQGPGLFEVTLGGQALSLVSIGSGSGYTLYGADASSFAGLNSTLSISAFGVTSGVTPNAIMLDGILFSSTPIPEPGSLSLFGLGLLGLFWQRREGSR